MTQNAVRTTHSTKDLDLPALDTRRWSAFLKEKVVRAIIDGRISQKDVKKLYDITSEELNGWIAGYEKNGRSGLKATYAQRTGRTIGSRRP